MEVQWTIPDVEAHLVLRPPSESPSILPTSSVFFESATSTLATDISFQYSVKNASDPTDAAQYMAHIELDTIPTASSSTIGIALFLIPSFPLLTYTDILFIIN